MATKTLNARLPHSRDTSSNWTQYDPILLNGEIIIVDTSEGEVRYKVGDGTKRYSQLPFDDEAIKALINGKMPAVSVTSDDNGKFLRVVHGVWAAATVPNANGESF